MELVKHSLVPTIIRIILHHKNENLVELALSTLGWTRLNFIVYSCCICAIIPVANIAGDSGPIRNICLNDGAVHGTVCNPSRYLTR